MPNAECLLAFADAVVGADDAALEAARDALKSACGSEVLVDTAAVVANFQRMVRIADSTGIPLDTGMTGLTAGIRDELGLNEFASASIGGRPHLPIGIVGALSNCHRRRKH